VLGIGVLVLVSVGAAMTALVVPPEWVALIGIAPLVLGLRQLFAQASTATGGPLTGAGMRTVAGVTIANGGDNLGVYIPLFAKDPGAIPLYVLVFAVGTLVWCVLGYALVSHPAVATTIQRYAHRALPWVLIGIGLYVLFGARSLVGV